MMKKLSIPSVLALLALIMCPQNTIADISIWFEPDPMNVSVGDTFTVNLFGSGGQDDYFNNWGLQLDYDHNLLSFDSAASDSDFNLIMGIQKSGDIISGQAMLPHGFPADGLFATLTFSCLGPGTSTVGFSSGQSHGFDFTLYDLMGEPASTVFRAWSYAQETVNQSIPEPATMLLLGLGLVGLAGARRKMRK